MNDKQKELLKKFQKENTETSTGVDVGKSAVSGGLRGLLSLLGLGGDIQQISRLAESSATAGAQRQLQDPEALANLPSGLQRAIKKQAEVEPTSITDRTLFPTSQQVISTVEPALPIVGYEPKTAMGRIAQSAGEFAGGGVPGKISAAPLAARTIGFGGIGATGASAEEVLNVPQEYVSLPLTVLAGGISSRAKPLEKALFDTLSDSGKARETMQAAKELDFPLTAVEAIGKPELDSLLLEAMRRKDSSKDIAEKFITPRESASEAAVSKQLEGLLGTPDIDQPLTEARKIGEGVRKVMSDVKKQRTAITSPYFNLTKTETVKDTNALQELIDDMALALREGDLTNKAETIVNNNLLKRISTPIKNEKGEITGYKIKKGLDNINKLDEVHREVLSELKTPESRDSIDKINAYKIQEFNSRLDNIILDSSENLKKGREIFKNVTEAMVNDIGETGLSDIAKSAAATDSTITMDFIVDFVTNKNVATPQTVNKMSLALNEVNPELFPKIASYYLRNAAKSSVKPGQEITSGAQFAKTVAGTKADKERLDAILTGVARAKGLNPKKVTSGFDKLLDVMFASGRLSQMKGAKVKVDVPSPTDKGLLSASFVQPGKPIGDFFARRRNKKFFDGFTKALMSDDALTALEELAGASFNRRGFQALVSTIIASSRELAPTVGTE